MAAESDDTDGPVSVEMRVEDGRTTITVSGDADPAVIVRSASGERIYLPPEEAVEPDADSPYRPAEVEDSPYEGVPTDSPYAAARQSPATLGLTPTANGFRIVHPEPVTDFRILR